MTVTVIPIVVSWSITGGLNKAIDGETVSWPFAGSASSTLIHGGSGAGCANWATIIAGTCSTTKSDTDPDPDLTDLDLTNIAGPFGRLNFTAIKLIAFINRSAAQAVTIGGAANPFQFGMTGDIVIPASGNLGPQVNPSAAGWTTSSANEIRLRTAASTAAYYLYIAGFGDYVT
jgi:hypothetical protein